MWLSVYQPAGYKANSATIDKFNNLANINDHVWPSTFQFTSNCGTEISQPVSPTDGYGGDARVKSMECSIIDLVEQSASSSGSESLAKAREASQLFDSMRIIIRQTNRNHSEEEEEFEEDEQKKFEEDKQSSQARSQPMTTGVSLFDLSVMVTSNLASKCKEAGKLDESIELYTQMCKMAPPNSGAASSLIGNSASGKNDLNGGQQQSNSRYLLYRFGMNIGNIYHSMGEYQKALKYYRLTLDRLSSIVGQRSLKLKLMHNISLSLIEMAHKQGDSSQQKSGDPVTSLNLLLKDNLSPDSPDLVYNANHHLFGLNLVCLHYERKDLRSMMSTFENLVKVDICRHYESITDSERKQSQFIGEKEAEAEKGDDRTSAELHDERDGSNQNGQTRPESDLHHPSKLTVNNSSPIQLDDHSLEWAIGLRRSQISRCLVTACNLMLDLETKSNNDPQLVIVTKETCLFEYCCDKLSQSLSYRSLLGDIRANQLARVLASATNDRQLDEVIRALAEIDRQQTVNQRQVDSQLPLPSQSSPAREALHSSVATRPSTGQASVRGGKFRSTGRIISSAWTEQSAVTSNVLLQQSVNDDSSHPTSRTTTATTKAIATTTTTTKHTNSSLTATNLCLFKWLLNDVKLGQEYGGRAIEMDSSNASAWINLANCHYQLGELKLAEQCLQRASMIEPARDWQVNYNLAIIKRQLLDGTRNDQVAALRNQVPTFITLDRRYLATLAYKKLILAPIQHIHLLTFMAQKSSLDNQQQQQTSQQQALFVLNELFANAKQAPELHLLHSRMTQANDFAMAKGLSLLKVAHGEHPYNLAILERLIALSIEAFDYELAEAFLIDCIRNRPDQIKWYLMLAECFRRAGNYTEAIRIYKETVDSFPRDSSCIKPLSKLANDLGLFELISWCDKRLQRFSNQ